MYEQMGMNERQLRLDIEAAIRQELDDRNQRTLEAHINELRANAQRELATRSEQLREEYVCVHVIGLLWEDLSVVKTAV